MIEITQLFDAQTLANMSDTPAEVAASVTLKLTNAQLETLCDVVYHGMLRAHPSLTRDEFLDLDATPYELVIAFLIVRAQSGMFGRPGQTATAQEGGDGMGEAQGAISPRIGIN